MNDFPLPPETMRDLYAILGHLARRAWRASKAFIKMISPFLRPPDDMEVRTRDGRRYTGAIIIEQNEIMTGAVVPVGQDEIRHDPFSGRARPWAGPEPEPPRGTALRHWAEDPRDVEVDPWLR